jgi:uncharacterized protein (DUF2336 family)
MGAEKKVSISSVLLSDIESALGQGSSERRTGVLLRVSDLFLGRATEYAEHQRTMIGAVMCQLMRCVENRALVELSCRLATISAAPANVIQVLARNDLIEISGPVLDQSALLTDDDLTEIATTKSQAHLSVIAGRSRLSETVTNVLVDQGNSDVVNIVAKNDGARFSKAGMNMLVMRANSDDQLTESIALRVDISPRLFRQLLVQATEAVRENLLAAARPQHRAVLTQILKEITAQVGKREFSPRDYAKARRIIQAFGHDTQRVKSVVVEFANAKLVTEMIAALSLLSKVPLIRVDQLFMAPSGFGLMVLCKAIGLNWTITKSVILNRPVELTDLNFTFDEMCEQYNNLPTTTAQRLLKGWVELQKSDKPLNTTIINENIHYID